MIRDKKKTNKLSIKILIGLVLGAISIYHLPVSAQTKPKDDAAASCFPQPDSEKQQYIIGYGSLMEEDSRRRTVPSAGTAYPVMVRGYQRGWFATGGSVGYDTTYLGVLPNPKAKFNAVIYKIPNQSELQATDQREFFYCRRLVTNREFDMMVDFIPKPEGQVWIYVNKPDAVQKANDRFPIVQSYVDIFLSGCFQQQELYNLSDFPQQCINTTTDWSSDWVNDRLYPRRPFIYQPRAGQIDRLLKEEIPQYFQEIKIDETP